MNDKYERQMKKGVLDMLVLKLLESEPRYGYQIIQELKDISLQFRGSSNQRILHLNDGKLVKEGL